MKKIKVSIILPSYQEQSHVEITLKLLKVFCKFEYEVLIVVDSIKDKTVLAFNDVKLDHPEARLIINNTGNSAINAIEVGIAEAIHDIILLHVIDDIGPILSFNKMHDLIFKGCDFVSANRYSKNGKRVGGSLISQIISRIGNYSLFILSNNCFLDSTTGIKMFKKEIFHRIDRISKPVGWAGIFEITLKIQTDPNLLLGEVPVISLDRIYGGESTFKLSSWIFEYFRWYFWGLINLKKKHKIVTLD